VAAGALVACGGSWQYLVVGRGAAADTGVPSLSRLVAAEGPHGPVPALAERSDRLCGARLSRSSGWSAGGVGGVGRVGGLGQVCARSLLVLGILALGEEVCLGISRVWSGGREGRGRGGDAEVVER